MVQSRQCGQWETESRRKPGKLELSSVFLRTRVHGVTKGEAEAGGAYSLHSEARALSGGRQRAHSRLEMEEVNACACTLGMSLESLWGTDYRWAITGVGRASRMLTLLSLSLSRNGDESNYYSRTLTCENQEDSVANTKRRKREE